MRPSKSDHLGLSVHSAAQLWASSEIARVLESSTCMVLFMLIWLRARGSKKYFVCNQLSTVEASVGESVVVVVVIAMGKQLLLFSAVCTGSVTCSESI